MGTIILLAMNIINSERKRTQALTALSSISNIETCSPMYPATCQYWETGIPISGVSISYIAPCLPYNFPMLKICIPRFGFRIFNVFSQMYPATSKYWETGIPRSGVSISYIATFFPIYHTTFEYWKICIPRSGFSISNIGTFFLHCTLQLLNIEKQVFHEQDLLSLIIL